MSSFFKLISLVPFVFFSLKTFALEDSSSKIRVGVRGDYLLLFGDLRNYFMNDLSVTGTGLYELGSHSLGSWYASSSFRYFSLESDDVRTSSKVKIATLGLGIHQDLIQASWYKLIVGTQLTSSVWFLKNRLSSNIKSTDSGFVFGALGEIKHSFEVLPLYFLDLITAIHFQELPTTHFYVSFGLGVSKNV